MSDKELTVKEEFEVRGLTPSTVSALRSSIYPGAKDESILLAVDYCRARDLDVMLKPVHLVPMSVKDAKTGKYNFIDVPMPGIGLYRIQADRSGNYAGADEPIYGEDVTETFNDKNNNKVEITYPKWCKYTVRKIVDGIERCYSSKEFWKENYATESKTSLTPNSMWKKRPYAQLAKCSEAQALRKAWPEIGSAPTADEMEGKELYEKDITPKKEKTSALRLTKNEEVNKKTGEITEAEPQKEKKPVKVNNREEDLAFVIGAINQSKDNDMLKKAHELAAAHMDEYPEDLNKGIGGAYKAKFAELNPK